MTKHEYELFKLKFIEDYVSVEIFLFIVLKVSQKSDMDRETHRDILDRDPKMGHSVLFLSRFHKYCLFV